MQRRHPRACPEDLPWLPAFTMGIGLLLCRRGCIASPEVDPRDKPEDDGRDFGHTGNHMRLPAEGERKGGGESGSLPRPHEVGERWAGEAGTERGRA